MNNEKNSHVIKVMSYLDGENENLGIKGDEKLIEKMENENYYLKNAFETIDDMEDISFSILNQIKRQHSHDNNIFINLIPIFIVSIMFISIKSLLNINFQIGNFINFLDILNNGSFVIKLLINEHYLSFIISEIFIITIIIIFLVKKGCMKNEI